MHKDPVNGTPLHSLCDIVAPFFNDIFRTSHMLITSCIHPIHAAAMFNRMRGLEGKYAPRHYVNRDVT